METSVENYIKGAKRNLDEIGRRVDQFIQVKGKGDDGSLYVEVSDILKAAIILYRRAGVEASKFLEVSKALDSYAQKLKEHFSEFTPKLIKCQGSKFHYTPQIRAKVLLGKLIEGSKTCQKLANKL